MPDQIDNLRTENEALRSALMAYADADNWSTEGDAHLGHDFEVVFHGHPGEHGYALAREALGMAPSLTTTTPRGITIVAREDDPK